MNLPAIHLVRSNEVLHDSYPNITDTLGLYLRLKGEGKDKNFITNTNRNIEYIVKILGNKPIRS